jgi:hypothetical protein
MRCIDPLAYPTLLNRARPQADKNLIQLALHDNHRGPMFCLSTADPFDALMDARGPSMKPTVDLTVQTVG